MEIITRQAWGAAPPDRALTRWNPAALQGVTVHWFGIPSSAHFGGDHASCPEMLRQVQRGHQSGEFVDIAYNHAVCPHGSVYELRGFEHQTGANGTTFANLNYAAVVVMVGEKDPASIFNPGVKASLAWILGRWFARGTGQRVVRHGHWTGSRCPGPFIGPWVDAGVWKTTPAPSPTKEPDMLTAEYKTWFREKYVLGKDVGPPPDGDWATAQWIMRTIVLYGPHEIFLRWNDWQDSGKDPDTRPDKAPVNVTRDAPRWWAGRSRLVGWAKDKGADVTAELQQQLVKVAGLQAQVDTLIAELDEARVAHGDQSETVKELRRRLRAVVPLLAEAQRIAEIEGSDG